VFKCCTVAFIDLFVVEFEIALAVDHTGVPNAIFFVRNVRDELVEVTW